MESEKYKDKVMQWNNNELVFQDALNKGVAGIAPTENDSLGEEIEYRWNVYKELKLELQKAKAADCKCFDGLPNQDEGGWVKWENASMVLMTEAEFLKRVESTDEKDNQIKTLQLEVEKKTNMLIKCEEYMTEKGVSHEYSIMKELRRML
jgi:hypothetical protein